MSYTSTTNLSLRKDNGDEKIVDMRPHLNTNLDVIDQAYGDLNSRYRGQQTWGGLKGTATWGELKGNDVSTASAQTTNLQLIKPGYDSEVDVDVFNDNMDIIDSSIKSLQDSVSVASGTGTRHATNTRDSAGTWCRWNRWGKLVVVEASAEMNVNVAAWNDTIVFTGLPNNSFVSGSLIAIDGKGAKESAVAVSGTNMLLSARGAAISAGDYVKIRLCYIAS